MHVQVFCVNPFQMNCLVCHDGRDAVLIDPGTYDASERAEVLAYIKSETLNLNRILLTHGHLDHVFDLAFFTRHFDLGFEMHAEDLPLVRDAPFRSQTFGLKMDHPPEPVKFVAEGDTIAIGGAALEIAHTPGHSPGSISFIDHENRFVIAGDVLFSGSVGRTDLWKGSMEVLLNTIASKLMVLPDDYRVYPGHGPSTSIGEERASNPFLTGS